ncbi:hypothetical protein AGMMS49940_00250 [Spirochaetia bacterium]|nr:hypothetical protein AGMMS49940_00250 [Spirochaetia bacterium]
MAAAQYVDMGSSGLVKEPGDKDFTFTQNRTANRADPGALPPEAIGTSGNIHEPVGGPPRRKGPGLYPFTREKPDGTDRTGSGRLNNFPYQNRILSSLKKELVPKIKESQRNHHEA